MAAISKLSILGMLPILAKHLGIDSQYVYDFEDWTTAPVAVGAGSISAYSANRARFFRFGQFCEVDLDFNVTIITSTITSVTFDIPATAPAIEGSVAAEYFGNGEATDSTNGSRQMLVVRKSTVSDQRITIADILAGAIPTGTNRRIKVKFRYPIAGR